ncbi:hypothetical protein LSCM1_07729 [Leishmania martiniquensis]|uniref:Kinetoplast-associated protein-like protein n=1 Tax=Leishmania martiniquensis TaxID=1580590 RepID=A0A836H928_9TRYP|nr:hypothetical protein LSCM1_07729 [Leishmania martiniquensis]
MEPRLGLRNTPPLRLSAQYSAGLSSSFAAEPRVSPGVSIVPKQGLKVAFEMSPLPRSLSSSSSLRLLQEIDETRKLLRTFRSLKERGARREELADLHSRVTALKEAQQWRQPRDAGTCRELARPVANAVSVDTAAAASTATTQSSFAHSPAASSSSSSYARRLPDIALHERPNGQSVEWSNGVRQPQPQKQQGAIEAHAAHRDGQIHEGRHHRRPHLHHTHLGPAASSSISTGPPAVVAQASTSVHSSAGNAVSSSSNAGTRSAAALQPNGALSVADPLVHLKSIAFAVALAEAHTRREIAHRWERRWLRHWASFKEERIAIALRPPATPMAALVRPQPQPERWAEAFPMALPRERQQWQQSTSSATTAAEVSRAAAVTIAHTIGASAAPVLGWSTGEAPTATTGGPVAKGPHQGSSPSDGRRGGVESREVAELHQEELPYVKDPSAAEDAVVWAGPLPPPHQQQPATSVIKRYADASPCAAVNVAAAEEAASSRKAAAPALSTWLAEAQAAAAAAVRSIESDEAAARAATESTAAEVWSRLALAESAARRRAEMAWKAARSLVAAETRIRVALEGDEARSRASHVEAERYAAERAALAAAEAAARRRAEEERARQEAQRQAEADAETAERRSIEQQWQAAIRLAKSLLSEWVRNAVATTSQLARSKGMSTPARSPRDEPSVENAQVKEAAGAQARAREQQQAVEGCMAACAAATDAVLGEWTHAAAAEAVRQRRAEEGATARAEAVAQERAAARAHVLCAEEKGRAALSTSEEEAWQQQQQRQRQAADVEVMRLAVREAQEEARRGTERAEAAARLQVEMDAVDEAVRLKALEEAARLQAERRADAARDLLAREAAAAALTATLCSAVSELSKYLLDSCLAEAAQETQKEEVAAVSAARDRAAVEELQMKCLETAQDEKALARDEVRSAALEELDRLRGSEATAATCKRVDVESVAATEERERQQQQQTCRKAAAECLQLSEWCDTLLLHILHDAASAAVSVAERTTTVANEFSLEAPPPAALPGEEVREARMFMKDGQQQQRHPTSNREPTDGPGVLTEKTRVDSVDSPDEAHVDAAAQKPVAATASPPLSPSSSSGPSSFFMGSASADATPGTVVTDAVKARTDECARLPSPAAFARLVDGLLSHVVHDAAMEAQAAAHVSEAITNQMDAAQRPRALHVPLLGGSDASLASIDSGGSCSSSVRSPPQALQLRPLMLPLAVVAGAGAADGHVPQVPYAGGGPHDSAEVVVAEKIGTVTWPPAAVSEMDSRALQRPIVSPLLMSSVDVTTANAAAISTASAAGGKERGCATGATTAASSPLHCFSTASSVDDDDAACCSFTAPEAPLPLHLEQHSILSPLLSQPYGNGGGVDDESGGAWTPAGSGEGNGEAATGTALADVPSSSYNREPRQQPHATAVADNRGATSGADGRLSAVVMAGSGAMGGITDDLRAFQLDAPSPSFAEVKPRAEVGIAAAHTNSVDAAAAVAASLVDYMVHEAALLAVSRQESVAANADSDRKGARDGVQAGHAAAAPPSPFSSAEGHEQNTANGTLSYHGSSASTSCRVLSPARAGDDEADAEKSVSAAESGPECTSADASEAALRVSRLSPPAAAAVAAESITGAHSPLASLSTLVSAVAAPSHFVAHLRQQEAERKAVAHQQNRYLTSRELALVAARYLASETAAAHVMAIGPTATLSARPVALVLSVGLVRAATLENRRARRRIEEAGKGGARSAGGGGTRSGGVFAEATGSPKSAQGSGAASPMSGYGGGDHRFPTSATGKTGTARDNGGIDFPLRSPSTRRRGDGFGPIGPATPGAAGGAGRGNGGVACSPYAAVAPAPTSSSIEGEDGKETDMSVGHMSQGLLSPSLQASPPCGSASKPLARGDVKGVPASNSTQQQAGARDKLPADWAAALRGVAERIARDFMDYASRCVLLGQGEGQSSQDSLRTARRIHSDALAHIDVQALFTQELQLRDVARLAYYYVELATNGPRDRVDPHCAPAALGEHNIFGRRSRGNAEGNEDGPSLSHPDATPARLPFPSHISHQRSRSSRGGSLLSAAAAIHVRRAGLLQLVLEQCVSNVLHDLVGDTVGWLWTAYLQAAPPGAIADGRP